jgi:hypothetical protein
MTDEYGDITRRLRDEGQASAPPDLLPSVMAEVRVEPRPARRRRWPALPRWQPMAAWTAGAAALVALGFLLSSLPGSGSSSSSSESTAAGAVHQRADAAGGVSANGQVFTLSETAARSILGRYYPDQPANLGASGHTVKVHVPGARYSYYAGKLQLAQQGIKSPMTYGATTEGQVVIRLLRARRR